MPEYNDSRRNYGDRPIRTSSSVGSPRPGISRTGTQRTGTRSASAQRAGASRSGAARSGARPANRPQGQNRRPAPGRAPQGRRPAPRRRRKTVQPRFFFILGVLVVLIIALILIFSGKGDRTTPGPQATPTVAPQNGGNLSNATVATQTVDPSTPDTPAEPDSIGAMSDADDDDEEEDNAPQISSADQVQVADLSINTSLPSEWMNILLLGTDERSLSEPARTDTMIIASINPSTGQVKLTSLLRDAAVKFDDLGKYSGTYRLNAANYFGGPQYAMKTINKLLDMNIQYYASVNFYGFTRIAQALGGIDVDITEAEMHEINKKQNQQYKAAINNGIDESQIINEKLEIYGANTHLNGRMTLAYARVRNTDSDITRAERQRTVIIKLAEKLRGKSAPEIIALLTSLSSDVTTNMDLNTVGEIAIAVLSSGITNVETLRLPENSTYTLDRRNEQEMLYDVDWTHNALQLYNFIYE